MSEPPEITPTEVQEQAEVIVTQGQDVRGRVSQLVSRAAEKCCLKPEGLLGLARSVLDGAAAAVNRAVPPQPESVLRQVVDGLGDGLATLALAARLAVEEANAQRKTFAAEDLTKFHTDLRAVGTKFVDTVSEYANKFRSVTAAQLGALREHATATVQRIQPGLEAAVSAAQQHPLQLGKESVGAGLTLSRQALGALFDTIGRGLQEAGKRLSGTGPQR